MSMGQDIVVDQFREFYTHHPPDIQFITDVNRRHFRFLLQSGMFFKIKDTIHSPQNLQRWLIKLHPLDVYYSTSAYLDPTSVASRPKKSTDYWGPGNVILYNDIAFDLDRRPLSFFNLERARKDTVRLLDFLSDRHYALKYIAFSGSKGFHLVFNDIESKIEPDFRLREKVIIQRRKTLVDEITKKGIKIDTSVTVDTRRIIRLPGTLNSKTGYCCQHLSIDELHTPVVDWIDSIASLADHTLIPRFKWKSLPKHKIKKRRAIVDKDTQYGYTTFITSSVLGTKGRHAVLISFPKGSLEWIIQTLLQIQKRYDLTDFYVFELSKMFQAICLKTVQRNRYQKILDFAHSSSANQLRNYNRVSLRMGPLVDQRMQMIEPPAKFITFLECPSELRDSNFVSQGHINFLKKHGLNPFEYQKIHGNDEFTLVDVEIKL